MVVNFFRIQLMVFPISFLILSSSNCFLILLSILNEKKKFFFIWFSSSDSETLVVVGLLSIILHNRTFWVGILLRDSCCMNSHLLCSTLLFREL